MARIEKHGQRYGLRLNKTKCEVLTNAHQPNVHFPDGTRVKIAEEVKYLGCCLNIRGDMAQEVSKRIGTCMGTLKKLQLFWRNSTCPVKFKILVKRKVQMKIKNKTYSYLMKCFKKTKINNCQFSILVIS